MKNAVRHTIAFLGVTLMATHVGPASAAAGAAAPFRDSGNGFEQPMPVTPAQEEVERLLKRIASNTAVAGMYAEKLDVTSVGSRLSYETRAAKLSAVKGAINAIGSDFRNLHEFRASALPWQESLMLRIEPVLVGLASHTTTAIDRLNEDRGKLES